jgi:predicted house-cleaning noncanonical NTP pyrophosphatase (MazG superfamily)
MTKIGDKLRYNIKDYLSDREVEKLMDLFEKIKLDLSDDGFPTRTNRLEAVENMKKVLEIHNYEISEYNPNTQTEGGQ